MLLHKKNLNQRLDRVYDAVIVGGGVAGLSAAIYLRRYHLSCLVVEKGRGRSFWIQNLTNYLGVPPETTGQYLLDQERKRVISLGADYLRGYVNIVFEKNDMFAVKVKVGRQDSIYPIFHCHYLIAASGIIDYLPQLSEMQNVYTYAGHNLHVCLICDGYEMSDRCCGLFVSSESAINTAFVLHWYTSRITVFTQGLFTVSEEMRQKLQTYGFTLIESKIQRFLGNNHIMTGVAIEDGTVIELEVGLVSMSSSCHSDYLQNINLEMKGNNFVTDSACRTSHPRVFAVGDLRVGLNQVSIAAADGTLAATSIWKDIRRTLPLPSENLLSGAAVHRKQSKALFS